MSNYSDLPEMSQRLITATALMFTMVGGIPAGAEEDPWTQGEQRGYMIALCQMEADGIITSEQSMTYLREYGELTYGFDQEYLKSILRNYIGLKRCSFSRRVVYEKKPLFP